MPLEKKIFDIVVVAKIVALFLPFDGVVVDRCTEKAFGEFPEPAHEFCHDQSPLSWCQFEALYTHSNLFQGEIEEISSRMKLKFEGPLNCPI